MFRPEEIGIAFTTYNSLFYLKLAIFSFLEYYPKFKDSIIVFDDDSSDDTNKWLSEEGIKKISWTKFPHVKNIELYKRLFRIVEDPVNLSLRNSFMLNDLFSQIKTKYLLINDSDIIFLKPDFLEKYYEQISKECKIIAPGENYNYKWKLSTKMPFESIKNYLKEYQILLSSDESMFRFHFMHALLDLDYFKSKNLLFDNISNPTFIKLVLEKTLLETGSDLTYQIIKEKIPFFKIDETVYNFHDPQHPLIVESAIKKCDVYHFRWKSSYEQVKKMYPNQEPPEFFQNKNKKEFEVCDFLRNKVNSLCIKYDIGRNYDSAY